MTGPIGLEEILIMTGNDGTYRTRGNFKLAACHGRKNPTPFCTIYTDWDFCVIFCKINCICMVVCIVVPLHAQCKHCYILYCVTLCYTTYM
jgi:hypothetical protein